jgi:hypothetical protein
VTIKTLTPGAVYGKLTVIEDCGRYQKSGTSFVGHYYLCKCECGRTAEVIVASLISGNSTTCGKCMGMNIQYGANLMHRYYDMISRCNNPANCNYKHYGARGIIVCDEWANSINGFDNFAKWSIENGYAKNLLIDRIDNDASYCPDNCRWVTKRISNINRRPTKNTSGYVGVRKHTSGKGWYGSLKIGNKDFYTGLSPDLITAVKMRNDYIINNSLENQLNNIPERP